MSIITTVYTERLTITTDDDGNRTITRSSYADTETAYRFAELSPEAQERAISDAIEEETNADNWYCSQSYFAEEEIWNAAQELEKHQPVEILTDQGGSPYGTARGNWWYHPAAWEQVSEQQDTGIWCSMDVCDVWNAYAARIVALQEGYEDADAAYYDAPEDSEEERIYIAIRDKCEETAEELTEEAARAVGNVIDGLIEAEREYYSSPEFWAEWLQDTDQYRFTRDGERIDAILNAR